MQIGFFMCARISQAIWSQGILRWIVFIVSSFALGKRNRLEGRDLLGLNSILILACAQKAAEADREEERVMDIKKSLFPLKKGQALVELALGMFALALVLSAIFSFTRYIVTSLDVQRKARVKAGVAAFSAGAAENDSAVATETQKVNVEKMSAEYIFGREEVDVKERVVIPGLGGLK
jgi:hypothetical protein